MRIVIAAPPKAGNSWLKCLFSEVYGLEWLLGTEIPERNDLAAFKAWVERGGFPDGSVYHQHYPYSREFCDLAAAIPAHIATIIRDPYDQFVSLYFFVQAQADNEHRAAKGKTRVADVMIGKPIDHPDPLDSLDRGFGLDLAKGLGWLRSGRSAVVRPAARTVQAAAPLRPTPSTRPAIAPATVAEKC